MRIFERSDDDDQKKKKMLKCIVKMHADNKYIGSNRIASTIVILPSLFRSRGVLHTNVRQALSRNQIEVCVAGKIRPCCGIWVPKTNSGSASKMIKSYYILHTLCAPPVSLSLSLSARLTSHKSKSESLKSVPCFGSFSRVRCTCAIIRYRRADILNQHIFVPKNSDEKYVHTRTHRTNGRKNKIN